MPDRPVDQSFLAPEFFFATLAQGSLKNGNWVNSILRQKEVYVVD